MIFIRRILSLLVPLGILFTGLAYLLPREVTVARSVVIAATPQEVWTQISTVRRINEWWPWSLQDPGLTSSFSGPERGVGGRVDWRSPSLGSAGFEISGLWENRLILGALDYGILGRDATTLVLDADSTGTRVTWTHISDAGQNPLARWSGLMADRWIGPEFDAALANLKIAIEGEAPVPVVVPDPASRAAPAAPPG